MTAKKKEQEVLGYAEFGAYLHRDNGGKAKIAAYTSVNKPLSVESHDETSKIASRRYKIIEEERAELDGNKFYQKDIWNEQEGSGKTTYENPSQSTEYSDTDSEGKGPLDRVGVLKNMVDKHIDSNNTESTNNNNTHLVLFGCLVAVAIAAGIALGIYFMG